MLDLNQGPVQFSDHGKEVSVAQIAIVRIPSLFAAGSLTLSATPPIGLAYLAASIRHAGHDVCFIDAVGEAIKHVYYFGRQYLFVNGLTQEQILGRIPQNVQFICVSIPFSHEWPLGKQICFVLKDKFPNAIIIGGGEHFTAMPEFSLKDCPAINYAVLGEGEETINELIAVHLRGESCSGVDGIAYRQGQDVVKTQRRTRIKEINAISRPAWDLLPLEEYLAGGYSFGVNIGRTVPMMATRGCPYQCTFCSSPSMWTTRWMARTPEDVIGEMEDYIVLYQAQNFDFYDLTAIIKKDWTVKFCQLLIERKLNITWQLPVGTRSEALDDETTKLLFKSGCCNITYAPESGSVETLKRIKKKINPDRMIASMRSAVANGINIKANMILGFPGEKFKNIFETYMFIIRMAWAGANDMNLTVFIAYPGSELFNDLVKEGRIPVLNDDYFLGLLSMTDINHVVSWNEYFSGFQLKYMRLFGLLLFYASCYVFRPWRLFKSIYNILRHKPQSRMEMIVEKALPRHKSVVMR